MYPACLILLLLIYLTFKSSVSPGKGICGYRFNILILSYDRACSLSHSITLMSHPINHTEGQTLIQPCVTVVAYAKSCFTLCGKTQHSPHLSKPRAVLSNQSSSTTE